MSTESELINNLERGYTHLGTTVVQDHVTGAMASYTPVRGSDQNKWITVDMDPVKRTFAHAVNNDNLRTVIEYIYANHNGWRVISQNMMPGHLCSVCRREDGKDVWYVDAPAHGQAVPNGYVIVSLPEKIGRQKEGWYYNRPNDDTDEGPYNTAEEVADAAWRDLES